MAPSLVVVNSWPRLVKSFESSPPFHKKNSPVSRSSRPASEESVSFTSDDDVERPDTDTDDRRIDHVRHVKKKRRKKKDQETMMRGLRLACLVVLVGHVVALFSQDGKGKSTG